MKKHPFKTLLTAFALCVCLLFPAACGGGGSGEGDEWWSNEGELTFDESGNVVFDNVEIKLSTVVAGEDKTAFNSLVARFNRLYDGKINVIPTNIGADVFEGTVSKQISNNSNAPDLIMSHQKAHRSFVENKIIQPFDEAMEASGIVVKPENFAAGLAQYSSLGYEGKTFSIPIDAQSAAVFYNKKALAKYGGTVPETRSELLDACERFSADPANAGKAPVAWATSESYFIDYVFPTAILQNGGRFFRTEDYTVDWYKNEENRKSFLDAIKSFRDLMDKGYAEYGEAASNALSGFMAGERLFYFASPWTMRILVEKYAEQAGVSEEILMDEYLGGASMAGWFAMTDNAAKNNIFGDSHFFVMSKTVKDVNKKAAICEFIRWFTEDGKIGADWAEAGHISASGIISSSDEYKNNRYVSDYITAFYGDLDNFRCIGSTPYYETILSNLGGLLTDTVGNTKNPSSATDEAALRQRQDDVNAQIAFF